MARDEATEALRAGEIDLPEDYDGPEFQPQDAPCLPGA